MNSQHIVTKFSFWKGELFNIISRCRCKSLPAAYCDKIFLLEGELYTMRGLTHCVKLVKNTYRTRIQVHIITAQAEKKQEDMKNQQ